MICLLTWASQRGYSRNYFLLFSPLVAGMASSFLWLTPNSLNQIDGPVTKELLRVQCFSSQPPSPTLWGALPSPGHLALRRDTRCLLTLLRLACFSGEGACGAVGDTECLLLLECRPGQVTSRGSFGSSVSDVGVDACCFPRGYNRV